MSKPPFWQAQSGERRRRLFRSTLERLNQLRYRRLSRFEIAPGGRLDVLQSPGSKIEKGPIVLVQRLGGCGFECIGQLRAGEIKDCALFLRGFSLRSEEHTSELQSRFDLV